MENTRHDPFKEKFVHRILSCCLSSTNLSFMSEHGGCFNGPFFIFLVIRQAFTACPYYFLIHVHELQIIKSFGFETI